MNPYTCFLLVTVILNDVLEVIYFYTTKMYFAF